MTLRLVLVGSGGGDGVDDSQRACDRELGRLHSELDECQIRRLGHPETGTADYVIVSDSYDIERLAPRPARSSLPATAPEPSARPGPPNASSAAFSSKPALLQDTRSATVRPVSFVRERKSFEPIWVGEKLNLGIAYELNLKNEGIGVVPPRVVRKPAATVEFDPIPVARSIERSSSSWLSGAGRWVLCSPGWSSRHPHPGDSSRSSWPRIPVAASLKS